MRHTSSRPPRDPLAAPRFTVVSFHAHPDDEALLTGGTLAKAAADGHRVVLVTATRGEKGLAGADDGHGEQLARRRVTELHAAAEALGCARVLCLDYADSGLHPDPTDDEAFSQVPVEAAARRLADVLLEERADVLTIYDRNGGYGHPDHVQVHRVGSRAAALAGTPVVLEATISASLFRAVLHALRVLGDGLGHSAPLGTTQIFTSGRNITHRVDVRRQLRHKRAAMAAHSSQHRGGSGLRVLDRLARLPAPLFALALGHEWYVEHNRVPGRRQRDVFATLREGPPAG